MEESGLPKRVVIFKQWRVWLFLAFTAETIAVYVFQKETVVQLIMASFAIITLGVFNFLFARSRDESELQSQGTLIVFVVGFLVSSIIFAWIVGEPAVSIDNETISDTISDNRLAVIVVGLLTVGTFFYSWPFYLQRRVLHAGNFEKQADEMSKTLRDIKLSVEKQVEEKPDDKLLKDFFGFIERMEGYTIADVRSRPRENGNLIDFLFGQTFSPIVYIIIGLVIEYGVFTR